MAKKHRLIYILQAPKPSFFIRIPHIQVAKKAGPDYYVEVKRPLTVDLE